MKQVTIFIIAIVAFIFASTYILEYGVNRASNTMVTILAICVEITMVVGIVLLLRSFNPKD